MHVLSLWHNGEDGGVAVRAMEIIANPFEVSLVIPGSEKKQGCRDLTV